MGVDINFSHYPGIFADRSMRGFRKLPGDTEIINGEEVTHYVSVGVWKDTQLTLDDLDELAFLAVYGAWEKLGCNMENRRLTVALTRALEWEGGDHKRRHHGGRDFKKLTVSLEKLATILLVFDRYESNKSRVIDPMTILTRVELFNRIESLKKGESYFSMSELYLNEHICRNIKDGKIKLFYLSELKSLRNRTARLIYNRLEYLCGVIELPFRREVFEFAKECQIVGEDNKILIKKFRRACKELIGKKLTSGVITECYIETIKQGNLIRWFFVCDVRKVITARPKKNGNGLPEVHVVADYEDLEYESQKIEDERLHKKYENLDPKEQEKIKQRGHAISLEQHNGFLAETSLCEAIREYFSLDNLANGVHALKPKALTNGTKTFRDHTPEAFYGTSAQLLAKLSKDITEAFSLAFEAKLAGGAVVTS